MFSSQFCTDLTETIEQAGSGFKVTFSGKSADMNRLYKTFKKHASAETLAVVTPDVLYLVCYDNGLVNLMVTSCPVEADGYGLVSALPAFWSIFPTKGDYSFTADENLVSGHIGKNKATVEQQHVRTPVMRRMLRVLDGQGGEELQKETWDVLSASLSALALDAYASASTRRLDVYAKPEHDGMSVMAFCGDDAHLGCVSKFVTRPVADFRLCVAKDSIKTLTAMFPPPKKKKDDDEDDAAAVIDVANMIVTQVRTGLVFQGRNELLYVPNLEAKEALFTRVPSTCARVMSLLRKDAPCVQIDVKEFAACLKQFKEVFADDSLPVQLAFEDDLLTLSQAKAVGNMNLHLVLDAHASENCSDSHVMVADFRLLAEVATSMRTGEWMLYLGDDATAPVIAFDRIDTDTMHTTYLVSTQ